MYDNRLRQCGREQSHEFRGGSVSNFSTCVLDTKILFSETSAIETMCLSVPIKKDGSIFWLLRFPILHFEKHGAKGGASWNQEARQQQSLDVSLSLS